MEFDEAKIDGRGTFRVIIFLFQLKFLSWLITLCLVKTNHVRTVYEESERFRSVSWGCATQRESIDLAMLVELIVNSDAMKTYREEYRELLVDIRLQIGRARGYNITNRM